MRAGLRALVVPGSHRVKAQAEAEGLDKVFLAAGFEWREPGCSMCLAMNPDKLAAGRALRVDLEPQLRGPPGPGRAHPPGLARRGRRHRGGRPLRHARRTCREARAASVTGRAVPLDRSDVDTDQIIPSDWLKRVERTGFGAGLFSEWRDDRDFVLNQPEYAGATILVAGPNFGTGSSREHAVWALHRLRVRGRRLAPLRRHLPQQLHQAGTAPGRGRARARAGPCSTPSPPTRRSSSPSTWPGARSRRRRPGWPAPFPLDEFTRERLLNGWDDIGLTLRHGDDIAAYERTRAAWMPRTAS